MSGFRRTLAVLGIVVAACSHSRADNPAPPRHARSTRPLPSQVVTEAPSQPSRGLEQKISRGDAAVLGVVEGLTEYLPVSSTGHLILASHYMGLSTFSQERGPFGRKIQKGDAIDAFEIVIQFGAVLAVLGLYRRRVGEMCAGLVGRNKAGLRLFLLLLVAFLPAAAVGLVLNGPIKQYLFAPIPVIIALAVGGVLMIVVEWLVRCRSKTAPRTALDNMLFRQAMIVGLAQCLALWPGTSRSMITILSALVVGLDMVSAAEFSFLLALPTLGAATIFEAAKHSHALTRAAGVDGLLIGLVLSGVVAALAVKGFVKWLTRHGLMPFGVYRLLLAAAVLLYFCL